MKKTIILFLSLFLTLSACQMEPKINLTPLEIQSMQSRAYDKPKDIVFPSVMSVLQDLGYSIKVADINTGLITAESTAKSNLAMKVWLGIAEVSQTTADAFIEEVQGKTKVRINFINVVKQSSSWGQNDREDKQILDPVPYQNAFEKVENAIFVRSGS
jgi:hypothetical protein